MARINDWSSAPMYRARVNYLKKKKRKIVARTALITNEKIGIQGLTFVAIDCSVSLLCRGRWLINNPSGVEKYGRDYRKMVYELVPIAAPRREDKEGRFQRRKIMEAVDVRRLTGRSRRENEKKFMQLLSRSRGRSRALATRYTQWDAFRIVFGLFRLLQHGRRSVAPFFNDCSGNSSQPVNAIIYFTTLRSRDHLMTHALCLDCRPYRSPIR